MATDDYAIDLTDDEVKALELPYIQAEEPPPVRAAEKVQDRAPAKVEEPRRVDQDQTALLERVKAAEARAASEREARLAAERTAHDSKTTVAITKAQAAESDFHAVSNALTKATSDVEAMKAAHRAALEAGDYEKATDAADKMAEARARIASLTDGKAELERQARAARANAEAATKTEAPKADISDPFEKFLSAQPPRAQAWFRDHPEFAPTSNAKNYNRALAAHYKMVADGVQEGSEAYFSSLDKELGLAKGSDEVDDNDEEVVEVEKAPVVKKAAPKERRVAAPVARDGVIERMADGKTRLVLTKEQADMADSLGMTRTQYAQNLLKIQMGSRDPNYSGPRLGQS